MSENINNTDTTQLITVGPCGTSYVESLPMWKAGYVYSRVGRDDEQ